MTETRRFAGVHSPTALMRFSMHERLPCLDLCAVGKIAYTLSPACRSRVLLDKGPSVYKTATAAVGGYGSPFFHFRRHKIVDRFYHFFSNLLLCFRALSFPTYTFSTRQIWILHPPAAGLTQTLFDPGQFLQERQNPRKTRQIWL